MTCPLVLCTCSLDAPVGQEGIGEARAPRPGRSRQADGAGARAASRRMSHAGVKVGPRRPEVADREARTTQLSSRARVHVVDCEHRFSAIIGDNSFQSGPPEIVLGKG